MAEEQQPKQVALLVWGVKQSFRAYVDAVGGVTTPGGGTERDAEGAFTFAASADSGLTLDAAGAPQGIGKFQGEVRFDAHGGMLAVFIADPMVEITATGAALTVHDSPKRTHRVEIASLDLAATTTDENGDLLIPTAVSMDGYHLLGDHYPPRTPLDPVRLRVG